MSEITGGELLARCLANEGIRFVFGLPCPEERMLYGRTFGTAMGDVRWDTVAEGLGCRAAYVDRLDDLAPALRAARTHAGPTVVCVRTDRDANLALPQDMVDRFWEVYQGPGG